MIAGKLYKIVYPFQGNTVGFDPRNRYLGRPVIYLGLHPDGVGHRLLLNGKVVSVDPGFTEFLEEIP